MVAIAALAGDLAGMVADFVAGDLADFVAGMIAGGVIRWYRVASRCVTLACEALALKGIGVGWARTDSTGSLGAGDILRANPVACI